MRPIMPPGPVMVFAQPWPNKPADGVHARRALIKRRDEKSVMFVHVNSIMSVGSRTCFALMTASERA